MNKVQWEYAVTKALVETIEAEIDNEEKRYILFHDIANEDGTVPEHLWQWDNDEEFDKYEDDFCRGVSDLDEEYQRAIKELRVAEENLISWGLSKAPQSIRDTLYDSRNQYTIRKKLLDLTFRLDAKTV